MVSKFFHKIEEEICLGVSVISSTLFLFIRASNATKSWTKYLLCDKETALKIYRSLQILNTQANNAISPQDIPGGHDFCPVRANYQLLCLR